MHPIAARSAIPAILPNPASIVRADSAAQPQVTPGGIPTGVPSADKAASAAAGDRSPPAFPAALSADDLDALQSVDQHTTGHGNSANSPAHLARAAIAADPGLAGVPFGHIVSQIARGETPVAGSPADGVTGTPTDPDTPPTDSTDAGTPPTDVADLPTDTPPSDTASDVPATDTPANTSDTASDLPPGDGTLPSDPAPTVAGPDPDQTLLDALAG